MDRWLQWVMVILIVAGIIALIALARGDVGRDDLPPAAIVSLMS